MLLLHIGRDDKDRFVSAAIGQFLKGFNLLMAEFSQMGNGQLRRHMIGDANLAGKINGILCCCGGNTDK